MTASSTRSYAYNRNWSNLMAHRTTGNDYKDCTFSARYVIRNLHDLQCFGPLLQTDHQTGLF